jgi:hypothetical protein
MAMNASCFFGKEVKVDVWLEVFRMAHIFNFKDRLELDYPTLPLADLLMTKLQIVELNEKDARDVVSLLADHNLSHNDENRDRINITRLAAQCSKEWGIYKTLTMNLNKIKTLVPEYLDHGNAEKSVLERLDEILNSIEAAPKTLSWRMRARIGERRQWYESPDVR